VTVIKPAMYLRISSDPEDTQLGVTRQREDCVKLCADRGWGQPAEFLDNDISAYSGEIRPGYQRMVEDIKAGTINAVVAWDLDRLHRQPIELEHFMKLADAKQLALATVSGDVDLSTEQGRLVARMKGSVAAYEIEQMRKRMKRKRLQVAKAGQRFVSWKYPPLGYTSEGKPDPEVAPAIKNAYAHLLAGGSLNEVCKQFNAAGIYSLTWEYPKHTNAEGNLVRVPGSTPQPVRRPWRPYNFSRFISSPRHAGLVVHQGQLLRDKDGQPVKGNWEAIVDPDTWFAVQNRPRTMPGRKTVRRHLLTGLLRCGKCGGSLRGWKAPRAGRQLGYYGCPECFGVAITARHVEELILAFIATRLAQPNAVELLKIEDSDADEAAAARAERAVVMTRLDQLALDYADGLLTGDQVRVATEKLQGKLELIDRREYDHSKVRVLADLPLGSPEIEKAIEALSPTRQRAIIEALLCRIVVSPTGRGRRKFDPRRVHLTWRADL
jgi:DNA invertase Pin-like site-specific DNA recombinase